jgi:hypothetical protein
MSVFTHLREATTFLDDATKLRIVHNMVHAMQLGNSEEYKALKIFNFVEDVPLDYNRACASFGKDRVDTIINDGTLTDDFHPLAGKNLDYWHTPEKRRRYYEEYMNSNQKIRRTGSIGVKLHPNFTIAQLEYSMSAL